MGRMIQAGLVGHWLERWLHRIKIPTLIVWGDQDRIIPVESADAWAKLIAGSTVLRVPDAGHLVLDDKPETAEAIARFFS